MGRNYDIYSAKEFKQNTVDQKEIGDAQFTPRPGYQLLMQNYLYNCELCLW
jgi:hypothetical protein